MLRTCRLASWALVALSPLAYLACASDDASDTPTSGTTDASTTDATTGTTTDAGTDASADADAAPPTSVTLTVIQQSTGAPEANASIVFYPPGGAASQTVTTDAMGKVTVELPTGGDVTAALGTVNAPRLVTILGVQAGDALTVLDTDITTFKSISFTITAPATAFPGTDHLGLAFGTCMTNVNGTTSGTVGLDCVYPGSTPAVSLLAYDASNKLLASTSVANVAISTTGPTPVTFATPWAAVGADVTITGTGFATSAAAGFSSVLPRLTHVAGKDHGAVGTTVYENSGQASYARPFTPLFGGATFVQNEIDAYEEQSASPYALVTRAIATRGSASANATLDMAGALPRITSATIGASKTLPTVTFTSDAPLTSTKAIVAKVRWTAGTIIAVAPAPVPPAPKPTPLEGTWLIVAPPSTTSITPPALPAALASFGPSDATVWTVPAFVGAVDGTLLPDYAAARAAGALLSPSRDLEFGYFTAVVPVLPADGTMKLTAYGQNAD